MCVYVYMCVKKKFANEYVINKNEFSLYYFNTHTVIYSAIHLYSLHFLFKGKFFSNTYVNLMSCASIVYSYIFN